MFIIKENNNSESKLKNWQKNSRKSIESKRRRL